MRSTLAIDTSGPTAYVALRIGRERFFARTHDRSLTHDEVLSTLVGDLCREGGISCADLGSVIVGLGPGSFTGLRIGLSFAKGLSFGLRVPLRGHLSMSAAWRELMTAGRGSGGAKFHSLVREAGRGELFCLQQISGTGLAEPEGGLRQIARDVFVRSLTSRDSTVGLVDAAPELEAELSALGVPLYRCRELGVSLLKLDEEGSLKPIDAGAHEMNHGGYRAAPPTTEEDAPGSTAEGLAGASGADWLNALALIEPLYGREVQAKTIRQRREEAAARSAGSDSR